MVVVRSRSCVSCVRMRDTTLNGAEIRRDFLTRRSQSFRVMEFLILISCIVYFERMWNEE